ncbi:MAG: membrane protein insertion efficiency factor YidD [Desulfobacterales bacterium]|nr:membrane protein insertion efficiency factor YidD [Desulfobacterales bacterium]
MIKKTILAVIRYYQKFLSPLKFPSCRFSPTCSSYAIQALEIHGLFKGLGLSILRMLKCHPFHPGGYDPVAKSDGK